MIVCGKIKNKKDNIGYIRRLYKWVCGKNIEWPKLGNFLE